MRASLNRREVLAAGVAGTAALWLPLPAGHARRVTRPLAADATFPSGVASGEPSQHGITLWAQVGGLERTSRLLIEIARDPGFDRVVHRQGVLALAAHGYAAKTRIDSRRLKPGERYFYRFASRAGSSPVGRFRTALPADSLEPQRVGFFSCQQWESGYFASHAALAAEDCDLLVCLGDYIYENNGDKGLPGRADTSSTAENGESETLEEYRAKYALYRSDPYLQALHASAPMLATWDDHEVENNHAGEHEGTTAGRRLPYLERRKNAYQVYFEQMPQRRIAGDRLYRRARLGGLIDLLMLDERQYRDEQPCDDRPILPCPENTDPGRTMLGPVQKAWLKRRLETSTAAWKLLGSSVEVMSWDSAPSAALNQDGWDGYQAERREILEHAVAKGVEDIAVITGDTHQFKSGQVTTTGRVGGTPAGVEFVGGSVTSRCVEQLEQGGELANREMLAANPHWRFVNFQRRGHSVMDVSARELRVRFRSPTDATLPDAPIETLASFRVERGTPDVERA
ncbi:MAG: alkaline phosphatase D family protein [Solirubrobacteraceae bacterium]